MTARRRLEAFWRAWEADKGKLDPVARSCINDLALILTEFLREQQGDPDAFWRLLECSRQSSPGTGSKSSES